jgi:methylated-DNA-[protein]-cysteine S-methyltransferase
MQSASVWWRQETPLGDVVVVVNDVGVRSLALGAPAGLPPHDEAFDDAPERDDDIARELDEYFAGTRRSFTVRADLSYVDPAHFGRRVLEELVREVPWGETVTYGELADMVGSPRAARAVGNVMAHNPVQILLPCHRVVAANGIGGYGSSGVETKRALLAIERVHLP